MPVHHSINVTSLVKIAPDLKTKSNYILVKLNWNNVSGDIISSSPDILNTSSHVPNTPSQIPDAPSDVPNTNTNTPRDKYQVCSPDIPYKRKDSPVPVVDVVVGWSAFARGGPGSG